MNNKTPVHNPTKMPIYVGSTMIPAGETRHFNLEDVPHHLRPVAVAPVAEAAPVDTVAELREKPAKAIIAALAGLSDADLERLGELEQQAKNPRTSLLREIGEAQLQRAEDATAASIAAQGGQQ